MKVKGCPTKSSVLVDLTINSLNVISTLEEKNLFNFIEWGESSKNICVFKDIVLIR